GVISQFLAAMQKGLPVNITGDGEQTRDFIYVKDAAAALQAAVTKIPNEIPWLVLNVGTGVPTSILNLRREMIQFFTNADEVPIFMPITPGDIRHSAACITGATEVLGFSPRYSLKERLAELFQDSVHLSKSSVVRNSKFRNGRAEGTTV